MQYNLRVKSEEFLNRVTEERNMLNTIKIRNAHRVGYVCLGTAFRNTLFMGRRWRHKHLLNDHKEKRR
jgi:hypothetical protein